MARSVPDRRHSTQDGISSKSSRRITKRLVKTLMRSYKFKLPNYDLPLRIRPWFVVITTVIMLILAFFGFTKSSHTLPLNEQIMHLVCLCLATIVFYFIFDVEEDARRIWIWRHSPLLLTGTTCFLIGGVLSEFVQSLLPYKEFELSNIAANLIGSAIGLWTAYYLEKYYRHRREIAKLYRPVALDPNDLDYSSSEEDDELSGTMLLPTHHEPVRPTTNKDTGRIRLGDVWDEREELFGIGDSDSEDEGHAGPRLPISPNTPAQVRTPKIVVTGS